MATLGLENVDASADSDVENEPPHLSDEDQGMVWYLWIFKSQGKKRKYYGEF